jgi:hypothetical protein
VARNNVNFGITGLQSLVSQFEGLGDKALDIVETRLRADLGEILQVSQEEYCPVNTGTLRSSGQVIVERNGSDVTGTIGYGGAAESYAVIVHETNRNYKVGSWKYLEIPFREMAPDAIEDIIQSLERGAA